MRVKLILRVAARVLVLGMLFGPLIQAPSQTRPASVPPGPLLEQGQVVMAGKTMSYVIRSLPVTSFPELPPAIAQTLTQRGCTIPQTYQARQPENVVHGSFARLGSSDWAVLCGVAGQVSLLVFFDAGTSGPPSVVVAQVLKTVTATSRLQTHDASGMLGFDWGLDAATPAQVHEAQSALSSRPAPPDHDALVETLIDHTTIYHFYANNAWSVLTTPE